MASIVYVVVDKNRTVFCLVARANNCQQVYGAGLRQRNVAKDNDVFWLAAHFPRHRVHAKKGHAPQRGRLIISHPLFDPLETP
ncbi:hypothetical protein [Actimicrobium antarcticum]|uniref:hypothetical protein n=1 Tax=Actimicrobium antarcticum TaxID=1051899 RepID=UPI0031E05854